MENKHAHGNIPTGPFPEGKHDQAPGRMSPQTVAVRARLLGGD